MTGCGRVVHTRGCWPGLHLRPEVQIARDESVSGRDAG
jgi:hypothetical protein